MNIDDLTLGQLKLLQNVLGGQAAEPVTKHIGEECIVRTYASGVHFGTVASQSGRQIEIENARRLWKWHAETGISLSDVAVGGIDQSKSRVCVAVPSMTILDALEIIPASQIARKSIASAEVASK